MADTFVKIATITVGGTGSTNLDFSSIPSTYTDLKLVFSLRTTYTGAGNQDISVFLNNNGSGYSFRQLYGTGNNVFSTNAASTPNAAADSNAATANTFSNGEFYFPNYTSSNYKSYSIDQVTENNVLNTNSYLIAGLWSNTAAINQISLQSGAYNFMQYSTATLYGIKNS